MITRVDTIHERDRQQDRQTDTARRHRPRLCIASRCKASSYAVEKRPRDTSCLSVVSFVASIVQYLERSFFIISYFGFGFTSADNLFLFCCLRRNVESCCHTHDSRSTVIVYSARAL